MSRRHGVALAAALWLLATLPPASAGATDVTSAQLRLLATRAGSGSPSALAALRTVSAIDGRPAALASVLQGASASQARARARALARAGTATPVPVGTVTPAPAARSRALAASILAQSRYGKATAPDPLQSGLSALGRALSSLASDTPGGPPVLWIVTAGLVLGLAATGARRALTRLPTTRVSAAGAGEGTVEDPAELERAAREAEAAGAYDEAVRLRFRAGLLTLGSRSAIDYRPSLLSADVARRLDSREFEALNDTFERVAYGDTTAQARDAQAARDGWTELLSKAGGQR